MNTQLYIEGYEVELDKSVQFAITKQFEDLSSPTAIINDWSKTVSIPFTESNNKLFGLLFRNDKSVVLSDSSSTGLYFNPNKKLDFKLSYNGSLIINGYAKVMSIKKSGGKGTFEVNLFGKLGEIFSELKDITFEKPEDEEDKKYYIGDVFQDTISRSLVKKSWTVEPDFTKSLINAETTDIIGFACANQGYNDNDFSSDSYQYSSNSTIQFSDFPIEQGKTLEEKYKEEGYSWDSVMKDGITPRAFGEYRSYYQVPFIYMPRMFEILQNKCKELTGYDLILSDRWFNYKNPYYKQLVMMLNRTSKDDNTAKHNSYMMSPMGVGGSWSWQSIQSGSYYNFWWKDVEILSEEIPILNGGTFGEDFTLSPDYEVKVKIPYSFKFQWTNELNGTVHFRNNTVFRMDVVARGENGYEKVLKRTVLKASQASYTPESSVDEKVITVSGALSKVSNGNSTWTYYTEFDDEFQATFDYAVYGDSVDFFWKGYFINTDSPLVCTPYGGSGYEIFGFTSIISSPRYYDTLTVSSTSTPVQVNMDLSNDGKSNSGLNLANIWDSETTFFEQILRYTKLFRLMWDVDSIKNTVTLLPISEYFEKYSICDWSDKVDYSKDFEITPILLENKYFKFNYEDSDSALNEDYKKLYGKNYGELTVKTNYAFNNTTKDLFENNQFGLTATESYLPWSSIKDRTFIYKVPTEIMPCLHDKDKNPIDSFGQYFFYKGRKSFDDTIYLTDDTDWQKNNGQYMYISSIEYGAFSERVTTYPHLDVFYEDKMCLYNVPMKSFCKDIDYSGKTSIYSNYWKDILENEIVSLDNHKLTCYVRLTPIDFNNFKFKNFVTINNQLYLVNKICDYSFDNLLTKCELIRINNPENYTKSTDTYKGLIATSETTLGYANGAISTEKKTVNYLFSLYDINFSNGSNTIKLPNGIKLSIEKLNPTLKQYNGTEYNYAMYMETYNNYNGSEDVRNDVSITNGYNTIDTMYITRYSDYPYPPKLRVYPTDIATGTGTIDIRLVSQFPPNSVEFIGSDGCTFTVGEWEEFNDDDYGWEATCSYDNQSKIKNALQKYNQSYEVTLKVVTGTNVTLTKTLNVARNSETVKIDFVDINDNVITTQPVVVVYDGSTISGFQKVETDGVTTIATTKEFDNGSTISVVNNKLLLTVDTDIAVPASAVSTETIYVKKFSGSTASAPGRNPSGETIDWDSLETIGNEETLGEE